MLIKHIKKMSTNDIGKKGEEEATLFLKEKGYTLLSKNYRSSRNEIDLIVKKAETIIFIEVKKRKNTHYGQPESFVSDDQKQRIHIAAEDYLEKENWNGEIRFDIISIQGQEVIHFEDAF